MDDLRINARITIPESELDERFVRSSGPGGQNVNKLNTKVELRFDAANSASLSDDVRKRLLKLAGQRATSDGVIVLESQSARTRERNREEARERLAELIRQALVRPKPRKRTKPTKASKQRRLDEKNRRSKIKQKRGRIRSGDD